MARLTGAIGVGLTVGLLPALPPFLTRTHAADSTTHARIQDPRLNECSGLERSRRHDGVFWALNDSGGQPELFALDAAGRALGRVRVLGAKNVDWEGITADDDGHLYLHDGGNNLNQRRDLVVYRIPEPSALDGEVTVDQVIPFVFPDQAAFPPAARNFDSEALFWDEGALHLLTKHRGDSRTTLRRFPAPRDPGTDAEGRGTPPGAPVSPPLTLELLGSFELGGDPDRFGGKVTAADRSPDGAWLAVLTYHAIFLFPRPAQPGGWLSGTPHRIDLDQLITQQDEALAWDGDGLLFSNEGGDLFRIANPLDPGCRRFPAPGCR